MLWVGGLWGTTTLPNTALATDDVIVTIDGEGEEPAVRQNPDGSTEIDTDDGGVVIQFGGALDADEDEPEDPKKFYANLADKIGDAMQLGTIADELLEQIDADDASRKSRLDTRARGIGLLGLQLEQVKSGVGDASAASDGGESVVVNPLLLEGCLKAWANAQAELLPAEGPCKVDHEGDDNTAQTDELADEFERGMNFYLTDTASEYGPDTSGMLLWGTILGGGGFKKVAVSPELRRPASLSVDEKDLIVSDTEKDFRSCARITHVITMRPSVLKRLQMRGFYRDFPLAPSTPPEVNAVTNRIADIQGTQASRQDRPEDTPYTLYETQCELNLPQFAPKAFAERGIPLPYLVTIEKDSRVVLSIRRDWKPEDEDCERKAMWVKYPYIPGPGFYGTGLLNVVGNSSAAMTAAWRLALDAGMYANMPGGLMSDLATRQKSNTFRPAPGEFPSIQTNGRDIREMIMALPYHDVTPGLMTLIDKITEQSKSTAGAVEIPMKEGIANIPVGTMLAYIEQASQLLAAAHKGMHRAQSEELKMLADLFREDPESFWKGNKKAKRFWNEQKLFQALETYSLVPKSDPNTPSHIHRLMKVTALVQLMQIPQFAPFLSVPGILDRVLTAMREDPTGIRINPPPPPPTPSPEQLTAQSKLMDSTTKAKDVQVKALKAVTDAQNREKELDGEERVETLKLAQTSIAHAADNKKAAADGAHKAATHGLAVAQAAHDMVLGEREQGLAEQQHAHEKQVHADQQALATKTQSDQAGLDAFKATNPPPLDPNKQGGGP